MKMKAPPKLTLFVILIIVGVLIASANLAALIFEIRLLREQNELLRINARCIGRELMIKEIEREAICGKALSSPTPTPHPH